jgi:hypothetical protein
MMHVQLPDRKYITLYEAVTAFVYGAPRDSLSAPFDESDNALVALEKELHAAAIAGKVRFRGLKAGDYKYQEIDPRYFKDRHHIDFHWKKNLIRCRFPEFYDVDRDAPLLKDMGISLEPSSLFRRRVPEWHDVHLDREQYASLLKNMGVSIEPSSGSDTPNEPKKIYSTGAAGRPTSKHLVIPEAQRRLDAGKYPETLTAFSGELAAWLKKAHPEAASMTAKTIGNTITRQWEAREKRPK